MRLSYGYLNTNQPLILFCGKLGLWALGTWLIVEFCVHPCFAFTRFGSTIEHGGTNETIGSTAFASSDERNASKRSPLDPSQLSSLIKDLQGSRFQQRERAFLTLWQSGPEADAALAELAKSPDPILATTASRLILLRKLGASPADVNESLSDLSLVRNGDFHTLVRLGQNGKWADVLTMLDLLDQEQLDRLLDDTANQEILLGLALDEQQERIFPALVDRLYPPTQARAARQLWKAFDFQFDEKLSKPTTDAVALLFEMEWSGNVEGAIEAAEESGQRGIADFIRRRHFRWNELARTDRKLPKPNELRHVDQLQDAVLQSLYHSWSNQLDESEKWKKLIVSVPRKSFEPFELSSALIAIGHTQEGIQALEEFSSLQAFDCYQYLGDQTSIFRLAGIKDVHNFDLEPWLKKKVLILKSGLSNGRQEFLMAAEVASLLYRIGRREEANKIEEELIKFGEANPASLADLLSNWGFQSRRDRALEFIADFLNRPNSQRANDRDSLNDLDNILDAVFEDFNGLGRALLYEIKAKHPELGWEESLQYLNQLYNGVMPERWKQPSDFASYIWQVFDSNAFEEQRGSHFAAELANLAKNLGFHQLSEQLLARVPESLNVLTMRVEAMANRGALDRALRLSELFYRRKPSDLQLHLSRSSWYEQLGQKDQAWKSKIRALAVPLSNDIYAISYAGLKEAGFVEESNRLIEFAWATADMKEERFDSLLRTLIEIVEKQDPERAAELARAWQAQSTLGNRRLGFTPKQQIYFQAKEFENESMKWVQLGDAAKAEAWLQRAYKLRPDDINIPIRIIPVAKSKFGVEVAERWFQPYFDYHLKHLEEWPQDAMFQNNLAWLAAKCELRLADALTHSQLACQIRPNDPTYLDTLAEVEFCLGNFDKAIELESACRKIDGKDPHNKEQLARFHEAKRRAAASRSSESVNAP